MKGLPAYCGHPVKLQVNAKVLQLLVSQYPNRWRRIARLGKYGRGVVTLYVPAGMLLNMGRDLCQIRETIYRAYPKLAILDNCSTSTELQQDALLMQLKELCMVINAMRDTAMQIFMDWADIGAGDIALHKQGGVSLPYFGDRE